MSRIEELEQQLIDEITRQERERYAKTAEELIQEYLKKLETVFTVRRANLPVVMAALRMHLKVLEGIDPLSTIFSKIMANTIKYAAEVEEVPE